MAEPRPPFGVLSTVTALGETQLPPRDAAAAGTVAAGSPRYTHTAALGRGGMGIVDLVWDGDLMRELAVKHMRPELRTDPKMVAQFLWEARVGAYLDHPNIVPVHDLGTTADAGPYFTMKRARGEPLDRELDRLRLRDAAAEARLPVARRIRILHQICQAIAFAHRRGVVHRDLKPANALLGDDGEVVVMDWGLAMPVPGPAGDRLRAVMPEGLETLSAGTPMYMSPEQASGDAIDERSDVYTLGVMLAEAVTLVPPSVAPATPGTPARAVLRPIREAWPAAPSSLVAVIEHATAPDPAARYQTAAELADDLERVVEGGTPVVERASIVTQAARFYMSHDRSIAGLRVVDVDLWAASATALGIAIGAAASGPIGAWWWLGLVAALILGWMPTRRWLALRRRADPAPGRDRRRGRPS